MRSTLISMVFIVVGCSTISRAGEPDVLSEHLKGNYARSIELYEKMPSAERTPVVIRAALESAIHLARFPEAIAIAEENDYRTDWYVPTLEARAARPLVIEIAEAETLPFTGGSSLDPYMPGVQGRILAAEGRAYAGPIRLDTGGEFLHLSARRAKELGIEPVACQEGRQAETKTNVCWAQVDLELGRIRMKKVPVAIIHSLPAAFEPILGTNVLEQFKTEMDYPAGRLVLRPRSASFPAISDRACVEAPFLMWADHFMFAKGRFGNQKSLNFFVDTGLVAVNTDGRQAAIKVATEDLKEWDVAFDESQKIFDPKMELGLEALPQEGHLVIHSKLENLGFDFGGVRIHGLLGHAYFKSYLWRLDFDRRVYTLCR